MHLISLPMRLLPRSFMHMAVERSLLNAKVSASFLLPAAIFRGLYRIPFQACSYSAMERF